MSDTGLNIVTGAFGYTGKYIAHRLLTRGIKVRTLTGHPDRANPFGDRVEAIPYNFHQPDKLAESLQGATTLFNTYWVRFPRGNVTYAKAVQNTRVLLTAAKQAGIQRIVHVSITNAAADSPLLYFRGKGQLENDIVESGLSHAIIRPTLIFGAEDILINNIAWLLRRFPAFAVPGRGEYKLQPVFVEDLAELAVNAAQNSENMLVDAVGPETYQFVELINLIKNTIGSKSKIMHLPPRQAYYLSKLIGVAMGDVILTEDEVKGLMDNLLVSQHPPTCETKLSEWLEKNSHSVGASYASELSRHY